MSRNLKRPASALLPLGALAAGFGLASAALAQTSTAPAAAETKAETKNDAKAETALPIVRARASAERAGKEDYQAVDTRIGKGKQELRDIPQSVTVVTEKLINDRNLDTMKEALKNTAGISFMAAEGGEEDIRLRGFSLQATGDIFSDGMRDPAFYERDTFNYDRMEVLRGSASMLFGRGSTGGAVNQVSKQPLLVTQGEVAATLGSGNYLRLTADANIRTGDESALRVNAMVTDAKNYGNKIDKKGVAAAYRFGIGNVDEVLISAYYLDNNNGINYGLPWIAKSKTDPTRVMLPIDARNYYGAASDYNAGSLTQGTLSHTHRFSSSNEIKTTLRLATIDRDQRASAIRFTAPVTAETLNDQTVLARSGGGVHAKIQNMDTAYLQSDYSGKHQWFGFTHSIQAGVDLAREKFNNFGISPQSPVMPKPTTTIGTPNDGAWVDESRRVTRLTSNFDAKSVGIYAQDLLQLSPHWKLLGGLRWDRFDGTYWQPELRNAADKVTQIEATRARVDSLWSKRAGLLYQPSATQSYHLSYSTSFNTSGDTYRFDPLGSNTPPEGSRNTELGAKLDFFDGRMSTRFALFYTDKYNERNRDELTVDPTNYVLSGARHAAGLEFDISGRITPQWEVYGSYAFIPDAKVDKGSAVNGVSLQGEAVGSRPGLTPRHSGTIWTTYKLNEAWRVGGGLNARSSDSPQLSPTIVAPSFVTADLMAEYTNGNLSLKFNATNITDELYADVLYRGHYVPGKPRTYQLTFAHKF
ncbi:TonB-dependent siderophore receptor [Paucibacter sp. KBW04]|uniref:TonB-dependent receptor n=1 Tax=Paucibacter sp. KBW04 TaxID=2153361 RepID=UPI000F57C7AB|nr:TonB-dependent receptor [Paucibacter sp. KBW04]RQO60456.1 TonB-dependent siderophore receptor [Paucibacter sp. KBW04]